jgi:hypothetical protein
MSQNIGHEIATLEHLSAGELRSRYADVFGEQTHANNKPWLIKRIAWRLQALQHGDLSDRARQRAAELANDADLRLSAPRPAKALPPTEPSRRDPRLPSPGSLLTRSYKGRTLHIQVLDHAFRYDGALYHSLSAVAKAITGSHCNGFHFFKLNQGAQP